MRNLVEWGSYHLPLDVYMYTCIYASIVYVYQGFIQDFRSGVKRRACQARPCFFETNRRQALPPEGVFLTRFEVVLKPL